MTTADEIATLQPAATATATAIGAATLLAACGGNDNSSPPAAFFRTETASEQPILGAHRAALGAQALPSPTALLDWAERQFPELFPGRSPDIVAAPFVFRHYPASGNYIGVAGQDVYVLGPPTGGELVRAGSLADFAPLVLGNPGPTSDEEAARFLQQAQFSSTPAEIAALRAAGYRPWLQTQLALPRGQSAWQWMEARGYNQINSALFFENGSYVDFALWRDLFTTPAQVRARWALALSEFFVVNINGVNGLQWNAFHLARYWDMLMTHADGSFRTLLEAVTLSPAMGGFLNTLGNEKEDSSTGRLPDENYAREVLQLFSIGLVQLERDGTPKRGADGRPLPSYTQNDITNLARVFTGWQADTDGSTNTTAHRYPIFDYRHSLRPMRLNSAKHSALSKQFLGARIAANTSGTQSLKIALDTIAAHPNVGPFFGRQMIQRLVTSDPSPAYVGRVAAAFDDNGQGQRGDLAAVFAAILTDPEARDASGLSSRTHGKLREPMVRVLQWGRNFGIQSQAGSWKMSAPIYTPRYSLGQSPLQAPSVFNFFRPGYVPPGTEMAASGSTAPEFQIINESTAAAYINWMNAMAVQGNPVRRPDRIEMWTEPAEDVFDIRAQYAQELALLPDADRLVRHLNLVLAAGQLSAASQGLIANALRSTGALGSADPQQRYWLIGTAVSMVMIAPEYLVQK